jgi:hypothetical protein
LVLRITATDNSITPLIDGVGVDQRSKLPKKLCRSHPNTAQLKYRLINPSAIKENDICMT